MQANSKKKTGAIIAATVVVVCTVLLIVGFYMIINGEELSGANWLLWLYIGSFAAIIVGVILALVQRLKEIGRGEEDEAKKY